MSTLSDESQSGLGWVYPSPYAAVPPASPTTESGITPLVDGQDYVDVLFVMTKVSLNWRFTDLQITNTVEVTPMNIWPGIVTAKSTGGFTLQLNGLPDTSNYYLHWTVLGEGSITTPATTYLLSGPSAGALSVASTAFTVQLPSDTAVTGMVTIIPDDDGDGGTFTPTSVELSTEAPTKTFTYTPASYGSKIISTTNDGGLEDPGSSNYTATAVTYTLSGPSSGDIDVESTDFTVALPVGGVVVGTMLVTPSDGGGGGTFTPFSVGLTTGAPSNTFTYTPDSYGIKTISVSNSGGLTNPASLVYTTASPYHLLDTLISYWALDVASGTRIDSHSTNDLAPGNAPVGATGVINNGCQFVAASNQALFVASNANLQCTSDFTWSFWVKFASIPANGGVISKSLSSGLGDYGVYIHPTVGLVFWFNDPTTYAVAVGSPLITGVWYHCVCWYDSIDAKLRIRVNDTTTYVSSMTAVPATGAGALFMGAMYDPLGTATVFYLDGILDEVGFWKRVLTAGEISALYNSGTGLPYSAFIA